jgi:uncharacterized protein (DUF427 family)
MADQRMKIPDEAHPIAIARNPSRVVVRLGGRVIADTTEALTLREAGYRPVQYVPRKDVDMSHFERTDRVTHCPYKGDAAHFTVAFAGAQAPNAAWSYEEPYPAVAGIRDHIAFYPGRVDRIDDGAPDGTQGT